MSARAATAIGVGEMQPEPGLVFNSPAVRQGEEVTVTGGGCPPGAAVAMSLGGAPLGEVVADGTGTFEVPMSSGPTDVGRYEVAANCGPTFTAPLDVVLVSQAGGSTSTAVVVVFFLLIGLLLYRRRLLPVEPR
ncbi:hypothetical protein Rwratislav_38456 [Rhodococcus wratislaviensis IFP 2016]|nr:hypothetical protein Rwratislav_38456 [Rhodococcus wratislaviensis IFP 2016]